MTAWAIGDYQVRSPVSSSGSTFLAARDGKDFILKVYMANDLEEQTRNEIMDKLALDHPLHRRICALADVGTFDGLLYIAAPYLDGYSLHYVLRALSTRRHVLSSRRHVRVVCWIIARLAEAAGSTTGSRYGDLLDVEGVSPEDLWITFQGDPMMVDPRWTGLARLFHPPSNRSLVHMAAYSMPTSWKVENEEEGHLVFTLAALVWELLVGYRLFRRESLLQTLRELSDPTVPSARLINPAVPQDLSDFLTGLLLSPKPLPLDSLLERLNECAGFSESEGRQAARSWISDLFPAQMITEPVRESERDQQQLSRLEEFLVQDGADWRAVEESTTYITAAPLLAETDLQGLSWLEESWDGRLSPQSSRPPVSGFKSISNGLRIPVSLPKVQMASLSCERMSSKGLSSKSKSGSGSS